MKKMIAKIEDMNFSGREYYLLRVCITMKTTRMKKTNKYVGRLL